MRLAANVARMRETVQDIRGKQRKKYDFEHPRINGRITLERIQIKYCRRAQTGSVSLRIGTSSGLWSIWQRSFGLRKISGHFSTSWRTASFSVKILHLVIYFTFVIPVCFTNICNFSISQTHHLLCNIIISGLHVSTVFSHHQALLRTSPRLI